MRRLLPDPLDSVDRDVLVEMYAPERIPAGPAHVRVNMISSLDGAISVNGRSGPLGGAADHEVFAVLRSHADVIVVGATTMRSEAYGPARLDAEHERRRRERGQSAQPPIAVVTGRPDFDWSSPFFAAARSRPIVLTTSSAAEALERDNDVTRVADVLVAGDKRVDLGAALALLAHRGARAVLVEGGPGINGELARADLVDELCLTLSPRVVGGEGPRILAGPVISPPYQPAIAHVLEADGFLFLRMSMRQSAGE
ncbi:MAG TPA: pyrimidine reductase family protein [Acidimicrobiia bacterium]|nr:pyrimidine reductase family protein [Acidimicrobiia bacterium]